MLLVAIFLVDQFVLKVKSCKQTPEITRDTKKKTSYKSNKHHVSAPLRPPPPPPSPPPPTPPPPPRSLRQTTKQSMRSTVNLLITVDGDDKYCENKKKKTGENYPFRLLQGERTSRACLDRWRTSCPRPWGSRSEKKKNENNNASLTDLVCACVRGGGGG